MPRPNRYRGPFLYNRIRHRCVNRWPWGAGWVWFMGCGLSVRSKQLPAPENLAAGVITCLECLAE